MTPAEPIAEIVVGSPSAGSGGALDSLGSSVGVSLGVSEGVSDGVPYGVSPSALGDGVSEDPGGPSALTELPPSSRGGMTLSSLISFQI